MNSGGMKFSLGFSDIPDGGKAGISRTVLKAFVLLCSPARQRGALFPLSPPHSPRRLYTSP